VTVHELSRADARRIAVRAQLLDSGRPRGLLDLVRHLTLLHIDPARARGPECVVEPWDVGEAGEPAVVEGVKGTWLMPR